VEYGGKIYAAQTTSTASSPWIISSWSSTGTTNFVNYFYSPINNLPAYPAGNSYTGLFLYCIGISTTGQLVIGDVNGRIWTSF
jgi:hypothetical protein